LLAQDAEAHYLALADFVAPRSTNVPDYVAMFAVSSGFGADELAKKFEKCGLASLSAFECCR